MIAEATTPEAVGLPIEFFPTIFIGLEAKVAPLPLSKRLGVGGALTPIGDWVLVLRFDGQAFAVGTDGATIMPDIIMPDNGFADYLEAIKKPQYADYDHRPDRFRYNDILYHSGPMGPRLLTSYLWWNAEAECFATTVSQPLLDKVPQTPSDISAAAEDWELLYRMEPCLPLRGVKNSIQGRGGGRTHGLLAGRHEGIFGKRRLRCTHPAWAACHAGVLGVRDGRYGRS